MTLERPARLGRTRLVTVDGPSGSGKSTLAAAVARGFLDAGVTCQLFATDHLATWENPTGWWSDLEAGVLRPMASGVPARIRVNDWTSGDPVPGDRVTFAVPEVLVLEGVSSSRRAVVDRATVSVWVEVAGRAARLERSVSRDGESSRGYLRQWQQDEEVWFAHDGTRSRADILLPLHP